MTTALEAIDERFADVDWAAAWERGVGGEAVVSLGGMLLDEEERHPQNDPDEDHGQDLGVPRRE